MSTTQVYCSSNSVGSSSSDSSRGTGRKNRFRTVHLKRPPGSCTFGFSFRGGREFGTGFFVSVVEPGSEAHLKGVKVGDQIVRINGLSVENATHQEILQLAQHHHHLTLSLKNVGLIPVKDNCEDPLTWRMVDSIHDPASMAAGCDIDRIVIDAPDGSKLGCGICKGPDWRPGIFVQYTKPGSLARQAGLQPGDQILQCNRVSFTDIDFSYAVSVLKGQGTLDLIVRKGSGIDLFPGESSGYSSASSTTDDANFIEARRNSKSNEKKSLKSVNNNPSDCVIPPPPPPISQLGHTSIPRPPPPAPPCGNNFQLGEPVHQLPSVVTYRQECRYGSQTVVQITGGSLQVDVHPGPPPSMSSLENSSSCSSLSQASLTSAISEELQRRKERKMKGVSLPERPQRKPVEGQTREHDLLIAELKRRHDNRTKSAIEQVPRPSTPTDSSPPSPDSLDSPPPCPTPDYSDTSARESPQPCHTVKSSILRFEEKTRKVTPKCVTFGGSSTKEITPNKPEPPRLPQTVEMDSIGPFELLQPKKSQAPKPPQTYFKPPARKDLQESPKRTTVIKITEYTTEKLPNKFDFLADKDKNCENFDNELAQTLSRANLKNKAEIVNNNNVIVKNPYNNNNSDKFIAPQFAPMQNISQDELSNVRKTLRTFDKHTGTNSIVVQLPKHI